MNENALVAAFIIVTGLARALFDSRRDTVNAYGSIPRECIKSRKTVFPVLWLHSIIWLFSYFGWLFDSPVFLVIYMLTGVVIRILWHVFDGCILTHYVNKACGIDILYDPLNGYTVFRNTFLIYGYVTAIWKLQILFSGSLSSSGG